MQGTNSFFKSKKLLYGVLGLLVVVVIAAGTAFTLSKLVGSNTDSDTTATSNTANDDAALALTLALTKQLTDVYKQSSADASQDVVLGAPNVQESATEGYKNARADIVAPESSEPLMAIFYQTPDSTWHFFTATKDQDALGCAEYNTEDLVNAFIGFTCIDETGEASYVERPPETFEVIPDSYGG